MSFSTAWWACQAIISTPPSPSITGSVFNCCSNLCRPRRRADSRAHLADASVTFATLVPLMGFINREEIRTNFRLISKTAIKSSGGKNDQRAIPFHPSTVPKPLRMDETWQQKEAKVSVEHEVRGKPNWFPSDINDSSSIGQYIWFSLTN